MYIAFVEVLAPSPGSVNLMIMQIILLYINICQ